MRVLSYNVFVGHLPWVHYGLAHSSRLVTQLREVRRANPDVIVFQEVHDGEAEARFRGFFNDYTFAASRSQERFGHLKILALCFVAYLPVATLLWLVSCEQLVLALYAVFVVMIANSGVGSFIMGGRPGLLLAWKTTSFQAVSIKPFEPFVCQDKDWHNRFCARGYQEVELRDATGNTLHIVHTHLDADGIGRIAQVKELPAPKARSLCIGDLNAAPDSDEIKELKAAGWVDTDTLDLPTWTSLDDWIYKFLYGALVEQKADYILRSAAWTAARTNHRVLACPGASDHACVIVDIEEGL